MKLFFKYGIIDQQLGFFGLVTQPGILVPLKSPKTAMAICKILLFEAMVAVLKYKLFSLWWSKRNSTIIKSRFQHPAMQSNVLSPSISFSRAWPPFSIHLPFKRTKLLYLELTCNKASSINNQNYQNSEIIAWKDLKMRTVQNNGLGRTILLNIANAQKTHNENLESNQRREYKFESCLCWQH